MYYYWARGQARTPEAAAEKSRDSKGGGEESITRIEKGTQCMSEFRNEGGNASHLGDDLEGDLRLGVPVLVRVQLQRCTHVQNHRIKTKSCIRVAIRDGHPVGAGLPSCLYRLLTASSDAASPICLVAIHDEMQNNNSEQNRNGGSEEDGKRTHGEDEVPVDEVRPARGPAAVRARREGRRRRAHLPRRLRLAAVRVSLHRRPIARALPPPLRLDRLIAAHF